MSIKNQLRAAILSGGATGASPSGQIVSISSKNTVADWDTICSFVASNCGYVSVRARSSSSGGMATIEATSTYSGMSWTFGGLDFGFYVPVKKGEAINVQGSALDEIRVTLVKLVGGGKSPVVQLVRRVVPCLRSTFDQCLSHIEKRIRACQRQLGLYTKRQRLTLMRRSAMSLKRTVGVQSKRTVRVTQHMLSATSRWSRSRLQQVLSEVGGLACLSKRRRAVHTCIALQQATEDQRRLPWSYSRTSDHNFCLGGL